MKRMSFIGTMLMTLIGSGQAMATLPADQKEWRGNQVISLLEFNERTIQDFLQGNMSEYAVECPAGACLPFKMVVKGEFLALDSEETTPIYLKFLKTCYIRYEGKDNFLFSIDLQKWKNFSEFFTGELKASIEAQNGGPIAGMELELNQRKA